jgi:carbon-monoxide dehydrogenase large subunit
MIHTARLLACGPYRIPHIRYEIRCVATNTPPVGAFRGAGRPEATHALERAVDALAARTGHDPADLRARNLIGADEFPYTTATGCTYDSGRYERALRVAMDVAGYPDLRREQAKRRQSGDDSVVGIGLSCYVEVSAAQPGFDREYAAAQAHPSGRVTLTVGTSGHGQGHWTVYAGLAAAILGVTPQDVDLVQSDTARVPEGAGTGGSRSAQVGGSAVRGACLALVEQAKSLAARLLGPDTGLAVLPGGGIGDATGSLSWAALAAAARSQGTALRAEYRFAQDGGTAPFGTHIAVVEIDCRTGAVTLRRMVAVDDCGTVLNPVLAEGQVHGGLAAGIAQVLFEEAGYDAEGRPLNGSFACYCMPSAADLPRFDVQHTLTPSPKNPLGAKGLGESGTTGSVAAVHNAVLDALAPLGVTELDPPFLPGRVWAAIQAARHRSAENAGPVLPAAAGRPARPAAVADQA